MLDRVEMQRVIDSLPWPESKKPHLSYGVHPSGSYLVLLHESISCGWKDIAKIAGPTPEGALRLALEEWMRAKDLNNDPVFFDALRRLQN